MTVFLSVLFYWLFGFALYRSIPERSLGDLESGELKTSVFVVALVVFISLWPYLAVRDIMRWLSNAIHQ